jgi:hypothetical protein
LQGTDDTGGQGVSPNKGVKHTAGQSAIEFVSHFVFLIDIDLFLSEARELDLTDSHL